MADKDDDVRFPATPGIKAAARQMGRTITSGLRPGEPVQAAGSAETYANRATVEAAPATRPADLTGTELRTLIGDTLGGSITLLDRVLALNRWQAARIRELEMDKAMSPDPTKEGIFRDHACWLCDNGVLPCVEKDSSRCSNPHARND